MVSTYKQDNRSIPNYKIDTIKSQTEGDHANQAAIFQPLKVTNDDFGSKTVFMCKTQSRFV